MWKALVILVRLPFTLLGVLLASVFGVPIILVIWLGRWAISLLLIPIAFVVALFENDKNWNSGMVEELGTPSDAFGLVNEMYKAILKWGFAED